MGVIGCKQCSSLHRVPLCLKEVHSFQMSETKGTQAWFSAVHSPKADK